MTQEPFFTKLENRGLIKISGSDQEIFLQGLITNDIRLLGETGRTGRERTLLYSCLLTPNGKFLFDFFLSKTPHTIELDCEGGQRAVDLARLLKKYVLRANVAIEICEDVPRYATINAPHHDNFVDPRHNAMGYRTHAPPSGIAEQPFDVWDAHRIRLGIPDGSRDMVPESSTLLECNIDKFNGISFDKGCYMGQELTARMHYRGLAKKHLQTVTAKSLGLPAL